MVEKFGKLVQLERLEGAIVNLQIEELKQKLDDAGEEYYNTMAQYEVNRMMKFLFLGKFSLFL
jgi:thermostable 8-oxoguanine DNA glycosylase